MSLTELFTTFVNNLLPVLTIGAAGFLLGRALSIDSRSLGRVIFYFFSPFYIFKPFLSKDFFLRIKLFIT